MGRAQGVCRLCPDGRRAGRNRAHRDDAAQQCAGCGQVVCTRHIVWRDDRWLCRTCDRQPRVGVVVGSVVVVAEAAAVEFAVCGAPRCGRLQVAHGFCLRDQWRARPSRA